MAHLTRQERCKIENFLNAGLKLKEIARNLGKSHTTIARKIKKLGPYGDNSTFLPGQMSWRAIDATEPPGKPLSDCNTVFGMRIK